MRGGIRSATITPPLPTTNRADLGFNSNVKYVFQKLKFGFKVSIGWICKEGNHHSPFANHQSARSGKLFVMIVKYMFAIGTNTFCNKENEIPGEKGRKTKENIGGGHSSSNQGNHQSPPDRCPHLLTQL